MDTSDKSWQQLLNSWQDENYKLVDLQLDVTVTVEKGGESFAYTVTYDRAVHYAVSYYTLDNNTAQYKWDNNKTFNAVNGGSSIIIKTNEASRKIVPHFDTANPESITYTRGVKQKTTAQE